MDDGTVSWRALLAETTQRLSSADPADVEVSNPAAEARWIIETASGLDGAELELGLDDLVTVGGVARLDAMVARRLGGEPVQYVLGSWAFRTLDLLCDERVLIPRPETEQVVGHVLDALDRIRSNRPDEHRLVVVDLGSGSGAIGLSIAAERPGTEVWLTDVSAAATAVSRANLAGLGMAGSKVQILEGSWFDPLPDDLRGRVDLVVSNPPYIAAEQELPSSVADWEPLGALVSGASGLEAYEAILEEVTDWLAPGGSVVFEIGSTQAPAVPSLVAAANLTEVVVHVDHADLPRAVVAWMPVSG